MSIQFAEKTTEDLSWLGQWASIALRDQLAEIQQGIPVLVRIYLWFGRPTIDAGLSLVLRGGMS